MSTELIAISTGLPKTALEKPLGTQEAALDIVRALTNEPARYKGVKKLDSVLVGNRPCIGVGTYGDAIVAVANDLPALSLAWETLRTEREASDFYFIGAYPTSAGVEILHTVGTTVVRHYSVTDDESNTTRAILPLSRSSLEASPCPGWRSSTRLRLSPTVASTRTGPGTCSTPTTC